MAGSDGEASGSRSARGASTGRSRLARVREQATVVGAVLARPSLGRAILAFGAFNVGEIATWIAILVYAYGRGGAVEAGVVAFAQLIPAAILAPIGATIADRYRRDVALAATYLIQGVAMLATAAAVVADMPSLVVYGFAAATASSVTLTRPAHAAILPALSRTPDELTAANVASGTVQHLSWLAAPLVTGALLSAGGAAAVFALTAALALGAAVLVSGLRGDPALLRGVGHDELRAPWRELAGGVAVVARLPEARVVAVLLAAAAVIEGALDVITVVLALELLGIGETGVGVLAGSVGAGGLIGIALSLALIGHGGLARPFALGLVMWGLPLSVIGAIPTTATAVALLVMAGIGRSVLDVAGRTLLQRVTPDAALSRVFGVLEGMYMGLLGLGAVAVPVLIELVGPRGAVAVVGLWLPVLVIILWRSIRSVDAVTVVRHREIGLLRAVPMFSRLPPPVIERLSQLLERSEAAAGGVIVRQGEPGAHVYVIGDGTVEVFVDGRLVRVEGPGEAFGEIALLHDRPRTASVVARERVELFALAREPFLEALAGHAPSRRAAEQLAGERLAT